MTETIQEGDRRAYDRPVEHPEQWFPDAEYERRLERTKAAMDRRDVDALVTTDPANINYLTGYDGWSFYVHQAAIVLPDLPQPFCVVRDIDASSAKKTTWIDDENVLYYGAEYVEGSNPLRFAADILGEWSDTHDTVGVDMDGFYFSPRDYQTLEAQLPDWELVDTTRLVNRVRMRKSDREIEYMQQAARITERAHEAIRETLGEGVRECEVAADIWHALIRGTDDYGGEYPSLVPLFGSRHLTWSDREYADGDMVAVELSGVRRRYHGPATRTYKVGTPTDAERETHGQLVDGLETLIDAAEPGITCGELAERYRDTVAYEPKAGRHGYSIGMSYPPSWLEMSANIRPDDDTVLEPNMVFHPILGADYGTFQISEAFLVTENGAEPLTDVPRELIAV